MNSTNECIYDALFDKLYFSSIGEFITVSIYVYVVFIHKGIFISNWYMIEIAILLFQFTNSLLYKRKSSKKSTLLHFRLYLIGLSFTIISVSVLGILYNFNDLKLTIILGIVFVALNTGGSLFHCYVKHVFTFYVITLFSVYTFITFLFIDQHPYLFFGSCVFMLTIAYIGIIINKILRDTFYMSDKNQERLKQTYLLNDELERQILVLENESKKKHDTEMKLLILNDSLIQTKKVFYEKLTLSGTMIKSVTNHIKKGILITDQLGNIDLANQHIQYIFKKIGFSIKSNLKSKISKLFHDDHHFQSLFPFTKVISNSQTKFIKKSKGLTICCTISLIEGADFVKNLWVFEDITLKTKNINHLNHLTNYDSLTGLPNRHSIYEMINKTLLSDPSNTFLTAFLFIDLDNFKFHNDSRGHDFGNSILLKVASILKNNIGNDNFVGRLGGDEFIVIVPKLTYKSDLSPTINKLQKSMNRNITINNITIPLSASIGFSFHPCDSTDIPTLINFADIAMYDAKKNKKDMPKKYLPRLSKKSDDNHKNIQKLRHAMDNDEFYFDYQPIYNLNNQSIDKVEALLRWDNNVSPQTFIPLAEEIGVINEIGLWSIEHIAKHCLMANQQSAKDIVFSINLSAKQLYNKAHINALLDTLLKTNLPPHLIEFEVTENALINYDVVKLFTQHSLDAGVNVSIDDFGTGYSNLRKLRQLHVNNIKIDKTFINRLNSHDNESKIINAIMGLSKLFSSSVTAVGIETHHQLKRCNENYCHYGQGYYFSKPIRLDTLLDKIKK